MDGKNVISLAIGAAIGVVIAKPLKKGLSLLSSAVARQVKTIEYAKADKGAEEKAKAPQPKKGNKASPKPKEG